MTWARLYYWGTVVLGMTEEQFWNCTLRKLMALVRIHKELNARPEYSEPD